MYMFNIRKKGQQMEHNFSRRIDKLLGYKTKYKLNEILEQWNDICDRRELKRIKQTSMIMSIYKEHFQSVVEPTKYQQMASQLRGKIAEELRNTLDNEQRKLLEQWEEYEDIVTKNKIQEAYVHGFVTGRTIKDETMREYKKNHKKGKKFDKT